MKKGGGGNFHTISTPVHGKKCFFSERNTRLLFLFQWTHFGHCGFLLPPNPSQTTLSPATSRPARPKVPKSSARCNNSLPNLPMLLRVWQHGQPSPHFQSFFPVLLHFISHSTRSLWGIRRLRVRYMMVSVKYTYNSSTICHKNTQGKSRGTFTLTTKKRLWWPTAELHYPGYIFRNLSSMFFYFTFTFFAIII